MLALLNFVLRHYPALESFERSTRSLSSFLFPSPSLLLSEACTLGNTVLLDLIWEASCTRAEDRRPGWSLTNYLRSDPQYYRWQFGKSLYAAAERGDLAVVEWLFAHFSGCEAPVEVVQNAVRGGHLRVLRFLGEHRSGGQYEADQTKCVGSPVTSGCSINFSGRYEGGRWGENVICRSVNNGELAQCLDEGMILDDEDRAAAIEEALCIGEFELAEQLLLPGMSVLNYATDRTRPEIVVKVLDAGFLKWNEQLAVSILSNVARSGTCALMKQILQLHSPLREDHSRWEYAWSRALEAACSGGNMSVLEWLMEHPLGHETCEQMKKWITAGKSTTERLFDKAAMAGNVEVMQYLYEKGLADLSPFATLYTVRKGHLNTVKWVVDHDLIGNQEAFSSVIKEAAMYGRIDILQLFQVLDQPGGYEAVGLKRRSTGPAFSFWGGYEVMFSAAAPGGQVAVLEWLQANYPTHCQADATDDVAYSGQRDPVKRLDANLTEDCTEMAMYLAIQNDHFDVVKWLYLNRPESRTQESIATAFAFGHVRIAYWLHSKCSDFDLINHLQTHFEAFHTFPERLMENPLEPLLFLRAVYPSKFTLGFVLRIQDDCERHRPSFTRELTLSWLEENCPGPAATAHSSFLELEDD